MRLGKSQRWFALVLPALVVGCGDSSVAGPANHDALSAGEAPALGVVASGSDVKAAAGPAAGFPVVIVRQGRGADRSGAAGAPVVDNLGDALGKVASGGTVRVQRGTYMVNGLAIDRPVTIVGAGSTPTIVPDPSAGSTNAFTITADGNTSIRNLRFVGFTDPVQVSEFGVSDPYDLVTIEDVHIELPDGFTSGVTAFPAPNADDGRTIIVRNSTIVGGWRGLHVQSDVPNFVALDNRMIDQDVDGASAIGFSDGASGRIEGNSLTGCHACIHVGGGVRTRGVVEIRGNQITIDFAKATPEAISGSGLEVRILDNVVEGVGGSRDASDQSTWPIQSSGIVVDGAESAEIRGNRVTGAWTGYSIGGDVGHVTALDNEADGVRTGLLSFFVDGSLTFQSSDFTNYDVSVHVDDTSGLDLTCNWWGSAGGPQNAEVFDASVYTPWATESVAGTSTTTCAGGL